MLAVATEPMLRQGRASTLETWIRAAMQFGPATPTRLLAEAELNYRAGEHASAESLALLVSDSMVDGATAFRALCLAGTAAHMRHSNDRSAIHFAHAFDRSLTSSSRSRALHGVFLAKAAEEDRGAEEVLNILRRTSDITADNRLRLAICEYSLGRSQGDLSHVVETCDLVAPLVSLVDDPLLISSFTQAHSYSLALAARYDESVKLARSGMDYCVTFKLMFALPHLTMTCALGEAGRGNFDESYRLIQRALREKHDQQAKAYIEGNSNVLLARLAISRGDFCESVQLLGPHVATIPELTMRAEALAARGLCLALAGKANAAEEARRHSIRMSHSAEAKGFALATSAVLAHDRGVATAEFTLSLLNSATQCGVIDPMIYAIRGRPELVDSAATCLAGEELLIRLLASARENALLKALGYAPEPAAADHATYGLTRRELEVAHLLVAGLRNRDIARRLFLSESTVKLHVRHILGKLGARSRSEAVSLLIRENVV